LKADIESLKEKLSQSEKIMNSNKDMISYLNQKLNENSAIRPGLKGLSTDYSSTNPNLNSYKSSITGLREEKEISGLKLGNGNGNQLQQNYYNTTQQSSDMYKVTGNNVILGSGNTGLSGLPGLQNTNYNIMGKQNSNSNLNSNINDNVLQQPQFHQTSTSQRSVQLGNTAQFNQTSQSSVKIYPFKY
jgi:hypothetical protein